MELVKERYGDVWPRSVDLKMATDDQTQKAENPCLTANQIFKLGETFE